MPGPIRPMRPHRASEGVHPSLRGLRNPRGGTRAAGTPAEEVASAAEGKKPRRSAGRRPKDPCAAALDLLRMQVLFLQGACTTEVQRQAPAFGIDPEFWNRDAHEFALQLFLRGGRKARR